ncbi:MAG TPA: acetylglutamate kinase [Vicinamibacterales bacterium]|nr:acetylglutamate kinase [Vicinamibacterales bacterium]
MQILKIGGELLETEADVRLMVTHVGAAAVREATVVVHGGGRELSAELARRGATPRMVDGVRVTDEDALAAAVSVLGGTINTRLVAALGAGGVRAVGLTGVDGGLLRARRSPRVRARSGAVVDLGHVGSPTPSGDASLLRALCADGWVPVVASLGVTAEGDVLNVNADVAAAHLAIVLSATRLVVLGGTDGVFDAAGNTISVLSRSEAEALIDSGAAKDGMAAKLEACTRASACGVADVRIVNGRGAELEAGGTRILAGGMARAS